ncbi:hypothetical protein MRX96_044244 [Rhipicephalus microplus]
MNQAQQQKLADQTEHPIRKKKGPNCVHIPTILSIARLTEQRSKQRGRGRILVLACKTGGHLIAQEAEQAAPGLGRTDNKA